MRAAKRVLLVLGLPVLTGCAGPPTLPPLPTSVLPQEEEYAFGGGTSNFDIAAWTRVFDALRADHPRLRLTSYLLPAGERPGALKAYYDRALLAQGWREVPGLPTLPGRMSWAFGYQKGRYVFAVVGLADRFAQGGRLPLNVLTDVPGPPER